MILDLRERMRSSEIFEGSKRWAGTILYYLIIYICIQCNAVCLSKATCKSWTMAPWPICALLRSVLVHMYIVIDHQVSLRLSESAF